jgi:hypothetical protein
MARGVLNENATVANLCDTTTNFRTDGNLSDMRTKMPDEKICVAKSFSLRRELIVAVRTRARALGTSMSSLVAAAVERDLERGLDQAPPPGPAKVERASARGIVVQGSIWTMNEVRSLLLSTGSPTNATKSTRFCW